MLQAVLFVIILLIENQVMCMQKDRAQKRRDLKGRIMLIHIKNENETAAIDTLGAELVSFMGDDGFEHIWQAATRRFCFLSSARCAITAHASTASGTK